MTADILFPNAEFYAAPSGQRLRVKIGEVFAIVLNDAPEGIAWATTADPILRVVESGSTSEVHADALGSSEIQVQVNRSVVMHIAVEVYSMEAASLGLAAGSPELK